AVITRPENLDRNRSSPCPATVVIASSLQLERQAGWGTAPALWPCRPAGRPGVDTRVSEACCKLVGIVLNRPAVVTPGRRQAGRPGQSGQPGLGRPESLPADPHRFARRRAGWP